jgi:hypothetical protein
MHPTQAIHDWIVVHPVAFPLIALGISIPVSVFSGEIRQFILLPPQKIGIWVLKARIATAESKSQTVHRMAESMHYSLFVMLRATCFMLAAIQMSLITDLTKLTNVPKPSNADYIHDIFL